MLTHTLSFRYLVQSFEEARAPKLISLTDRSAYSRARAVNTSSPDPVLPTYAGRQQEPFKIQRITYHADLLRLFHCERNIPKHRRKMRGILYNQVFHVQFSIIRWPKRRWPAFLDDSRSFLGHVKIFDNPFYTVEV